MDITMRPSPSSVEGEGLGMDAAGSTIELVIKLIPILLLCLVPVLYQIGKERTRHTGDKEQTNSKIIRTPPIIASHIPFIGHAIGFMHEGHDYFARLTSTIKCPAFTISILGQKLTFIQPELARHVARNPHLLFMPVTVSIFRRALHFDPSTCDLLMEETESSRSFNHKILATTREVLASPQALPRHIRIFDDCLDGMISELVDQDQGRVMAISEWTMRVITTAVGRILWGDVAGTSLVSDKSFVEQLQFVMANLRSLTGPEWLISRTLKASRNEIRTRFKRDARSPTYQPGSFSEKLHELCKQEGGSDDTFADLQLLLVGGASPNPALSASWFLMHLLCGDQQWLSDTRSEIRAWVEREDGHINLRQVREHCPRLMATWCESLRHHSGFSIGRYASQDTVLANQWNLDKDSYLMVSLQASHVGEDAWGSRDAEFVPQRFLNSDGNFNSTRERRLKTFGMLGTICPGKTLAVHLAMGLAIRLLHSLDFDLAGSESRQLPLQSNNSLLGVPLPTSDLMALTLYYALRQQSALRYQGVILGTVNALLAANTPFSAEPTCKEINENEELVKNGLDGYCIFDVEVAGSSSRARLAGAKAKDYTVAEWPAANPDEPSAHGPDFNGAGVKWGTWTNGDTSADIKSKTGVTWYSLNKAPWHRPFKWRLTVNINDT